MTPIARIGRAARMHRLGWVLALIVSQLAALLVPLAHAQPKAGFIEVCTVAGVQRQPTEPETDHRHGCEFCPLCRVINAAAVPPAVAETANGAGPMQAVAPATTTAAARAVLPYDAPARAPPQ